MSRRIIVGKKKKIDANKYPIRNYEPTNCSSHPANQQIEIGKNMIDLNRNMQIAN